MTSAQFDIQLVAVMTAAACALPGSFLILRKMGMMTDAISHAILPGIVVGFFLTENLSSPFLVIAAAATGVLTVFLVEVIRDTKLVKEDAAIGLVFPALFSIGVVLISRFAGDVHLDADVVLLGELAFAPFDRMMLFGADVGPRGLYVSGGVFLLSAAFIGAFYKELKCSTFDPALAAALGLAPGLLHYGLMSVVSMTAVAAFDVVGSILVVAMFVGPPAAAYLLTDRLPVMLGGSVGIGAACAIAGYWVAHVLDVSIAGSMAGCIGVAFGLTFLFSPERGIVASWRRRRRQKWVFAAQMLLVHLFHHEDTPEEAIENRSRHLQEHFGWTADAAEKTVDYADERDWLTVEDERLRLTSSGRDEARRVLRRGTGGARAQAPVGSMAHASARRVAEPA
ncbi:zinc ABC transporter permease [Longibacter salinarum]|uniref:Zinc ABC transporter permease n=1 Tax=Longibacter salinarum TaxID=1850348 RepID=A0A2A8CXH8_9BACT|nr:metal ABC transporter permease [Longibacter salinarum]PEN13412.1 zinc ABC transporter permease [Longibacter salinarum]